ncbi:uncharacterized protein J8A68_002314 [[Candida] subhashii]|uniref:Amino acid transporter transmembrane domain-containing protein n=1 Tax=[Candida] subhashii TaxID=561895 RepID=A0A8J5QGI1_9ASCO|nr:uncharacterized protein J8A68_002314 [[Candida] subhashii]KAG7664176.1 hypothetical protein J8A68_002314 [[Candida] subhashii]
MRQANISNSSFQNTEASPVRSATPASLRSSNSTSNLRTVMPITNIQNSHSQQDHSSSSVSQSYEEQISNLNSLASQGLDLKTIGKHLVSPEESLKLQGGDISRRLYHQLEHAAIADENHPDGINIPDPKKRTRSSSFSAYLEETRRGSTASDINVPGGFRREFLIQQAIQRNQEPPNFLTRNFMEFLSIYGHFAGEDFSDEEEGVSEESSQYEDVFDEESSLLAVERRAYGTAPRQPKKSRPKFREQPTGTASIPKAFFLVFKSLVGSGVLFLPRAFYNGGLLFSIVTLTMFGLLTYICYIALIDAKNTLGLTSYGELGYKTYGKPLKYSILVSIIISQIGFVTTYILFTSENMIAFISHYLETTPDWLTSVNLVIIQCIVMIPLVLIRNLTKLSLVSVISSAFIIIGLVIIYWFSGLNIYLNGIGPNITNFNPNSWTMLIGVAVTSFEGIGLILPIEASMKQPEKFPMVLSISMVVITALFVAIGTLGYLSFGDEVRSIIILNLPQSSIAVQSILVLYSIAVFLTAPLQLFPAIKIGESLIFRHKRNGQRDDDGKLYHQSGKYNPLVKWLKNLFRAIAVIVISTVAYLNANHIDKFVSFNGCFACIPLVYIYPPLIHLKTMRSDSKTTKEKIFTIFDYLLITVGILTVIYSTYQILFLN